MSASDVSEGHLRSNRSTEGSPRSERGPEPRSVEGRPSTDRPTEGRPRSERPRRRLRGWWARRGLRTRITLAVAVVAVVVLLALARLWVGLLLSAVVASGDGELRDRATTAGVAVTAGAPPPLGVRVVDLAGAPADGRGPLPLDPAQVRTLAAGEPVTTGVPGGPAAHDEPGGPTRWVAVPVTLPDGSRRLVLAVRDLDGAVALLRGAAGWFLPAVLVAAAALTAAAWVATRAALRPVDRLRAAAAGLDVGRRLPVPVAADELTALAVEINALLARRDEAVDRLRRFSDDAAHELRSPIASLRAQAEVAVAHPSPGSSEEDRAAWRGVARDAERLSALVADLLALARAEGGTRGEAVPVDLADALGEALARAGDDAVATTVWVPVPVRAAATPAEVGLVLDNLLGNARRSRPQRRARVRGARGPLGAPARRRRRARHPGRRPRADLRPLHPARRHERRVRRRAGPRARRPARRGARRDRAAPGARPTGAPGSPCAGRPPTDHPGPRVPGGPDVGRTMTRVSTTIALHEARPDVEPGLGALHGYLDDVIGRMQGRPATADEVAAFAALSPDEGLVAPLGTFLVAVQDDGEAVGCVGLRWRGEDVPEDAAEIKRMWTAPAVRGHGVGKLLLDEVVRARPRGRPRPAGARLARRPDRGPHALRAGRVRRGRALQRQPPRPGLVRAGPRVTPELPMTLRRVTATRYVTPLREGGSLPGVVEADDLGTYVVKFTGAGQGVKALVAEVVAGELGRALGLRVPELVVVDLDPVVARAEPDWEVQELLARSGGPNLGMDFLPGAIGFDPVAHTVDPDEAARVLWFDALVENVDRTWRNPNLLRWHRQALVHRPRRLPLLPPLLGARGRRRRAGLRHLRPRAGAVHDGGVPGGGRRGARPGGDAGGPRGGGGHGARGVARRGRALLLGRGGAGGLRRAPARAAGGAGVGAVSHRRTPTSGRRCAWCPASTAASA